MRKTALALVAALLACGGLAATAAPARAEIEVDVNRGDIRPLPLSVPLRRRSLLPLLRRR